MTGDGLGFLDIVISLVVNGKFVGNLYWSADTSGSEESVIKIKLFQGNLRINKINSTGDMRSTQ